MKRTLCLTKRSMADNAPKVWFTAMKKNTPSLQQTEIVSCEVLVYNSTSTGVL